MTSVGTAKTTTAAEIRYLEPDACIERKQPQPQLIDKNGCK